ncbi:hypothetical protein QE342_gp041 [Pseudomonas phage vB_PaeS_B8]|uniref:Uncharacterized protein n=5 Tax=Pakpunavirus TaxID=1921407 RepID=V5JXM6_9CAUD|nr:hypothetical protein PAK_P400131 [Pseudomonas phage PAK_P4]YP_010762682.1 hypothetical protein QE326_gp007 [Pseudomonas phage PaZq-1]YP_010762999.1 hypothetical protein QE328_gp010 [Pseudomonas phage vB_PaM_EPA1]YP_010763825.1 hypothetical protein QE332_gp107 [Pseudomonas phage vB_PaeM_LCK69]YP_010764379.1 hypothetical protein QE342_gp041 [Pseudomonas phage vB_PaeS_B8]YP_010764841.1 hypothetical protein QE345_gp133 [Pseudomonas phage vB_PA45_GUMS]AXC34773.1 hypothetical protein [Pseudomona
MEIIPMLFVLALAWGIAFMWTYMGITEYFKDNFPASATKDHREGIEAFAIVLGLLWPITFTVYASFLLLYATYSVLKVVLLPKWALSIWNSRKLLKRIAPWNK